jgi:hypothetical protein
LKNPERNPGLPGTKTFTIPIASEKAKSSPVLASGSLILITDVHNSMEQEKMP